MAKKPRGKNLTERLVEVLNEMKKMGYKAAPISRSTVQRRLGLKSRSTLVLEGRGQLIDRARDIQLDDAGLDKNKKLRRKTQDEQIQALKEKITSIERDLDILVGKFAMVVNGLQAKGLSIEDIMLPLRPNFKKQKKK